MAEGGYKEDLSRSMLMGSEDGDLRYSIRMGSQESYEHYCEPCDVDHHQVEASFYCNNCHEYLCRQCSRSHKKFKEMSDHEILDVNHMTYKTLVSKKRQASTVTMATHVKDIKVGDNNRSSALMSTNQLLVAVSTCSINKVILVDTASSSHVSELELSGEPWQMTRISNTEAAVTLPYDKMIVLLRTLPQLSVVREISVQEQYCGIAHNDKTLIVTKVGQVDILDMFGKVLRSISTDHTGNKMFTAPRYVTMDIVTGSMYVSDWGDLLKTGSVVKLSKEGNMLATYSSDKGGYPRQVILDTQGMLYVAWADKFGLSGHVEQLCANCDWVRTIIDDLSPAPQALNYDKVTKQLYVGQHSGVVKVYRLS